MVFTYLGVKGGETSRSCSPFDGFKKSSYLWQGLEQGQSAELCHCSPSPYWGCMSCSYCTFTVLKCFCN